MLFIAALDKCSLSARCCQEKKLSLTCRPVVGRRAKITALGTYVPPKVITNQDLEKMVDTNDQWIMERTGIRERHMLEQGQGRKRHLHRGGEEVPGGAGNCAD